MHRQGALLTFQIDHNDAIGFFDLSTSPPDARTRAYFEGHELELQDVQPYPQTPDAQIPPQDYSATVVMRLAPLPVLATTKNTAFVLRPGQQAQVVDENVRVTFVRVNQDSRCPYRATCATRGSATVQATLETADGTTYTFMLNDDGRGGTRTPDSGAFGMELLALTPYPSANFIDSTIAPGDYEATLVARKFASPTAPTPAPTAVLTTGCTGLSAADARGILGAPVQNENVVGILISSELNDDLNMTTPHGTCGYLSTTRTDNVTFGAGEPRIVAPQPVSYTVTAAQLTGATATELLRVADIVRGADENVDLTPYYILETYLAAGNWDSVTNFLGALAGGTDTAHSTPVGELGKSAVWVWRPGAHGNYSAVVVQTENGFTLIEALTSPTIAETGAKEALLTLAQKLVK